MSKINELRASLQRLEDRNRYSTWTQEEYKLKEKYEAEIKELERQSRQAGTSG